MTVHRRDVESICPSTAGRAALAAAAFQLQTQSSLQPQALVRASTAFAMARQGAVQALRRVWQLQQRQAYSAQSTETRPTVVVFLGPPVSLDPVFCSIGPHALALRAAVARHNRCCGRSHIMAMLKRSPGCIQPQPPRNAATATATINCRASGRAPTPRVCRITLAWTTSPLGTWCATRCARARKWASR